MHVSDDAAITC